MLFVRRAKFKGNNRTCLSIIVVPNKCATSNYPILSRNQCRNVCTLNEKNHLNAAHTPSQRFASKEDEALIKKYGLITLNTTLDVYAIRVKIGKLFNEFQKSLNVSEFLRYKSYLFSQHDKLHVQDLLKKIGKDVYDTALSNNLLYQKKGLVYDFLALEPEDQFAKIINSTEINDNKVKHHLIYQVMRLCKMYQNNLATFQIVELSQYMLDTLSPQEYSIFYKSLIENDFPLDDRNQSLKIIKDKMLQYGSVDDQRLVTFECFADKEQKMLPDIYQRKFLKLHTAEQIKFLVEWMMKQKTRTINNNLIKSYIILFNEKVTFSALAGHYTELKNNNMQFELCILSLKFMLQNSQNPQVVEAASDIINNTLHKMQNNLPKDLYEKKLKTLCLTVLNSFARSQALTTSTLKFARDICFHVLSKDIKGQNDFSDDFKKTIFSKFNTMLMAYFNDSKVLFKFYEKLDPKILELCNILLILKTSKFKSNPSDRETFKKNAKKNQFFECSYIDHVVFHGWYNTVVLPRISTEKKLRESFQKYVYYVQQHPKFMVDESVLNLFVKHAILKMKNSDLALSLIGTFMKRVSKEQLTLLPSSHCQSSFFIFLHLCRGTPLKYDGWFHKMTNIMHSTNIEFSGKLMQKAIMRYWNLRMRSRASKLYSTFLEKNYRLTNPFVVVLADVKKWELPSHVTPEYVEKCKRRVERVLKAGKIDVDDTNSQNVNLVESTGLDDKEVIEMDYEEDNDSSTSTCLEKAESAMDNLKNALFAPSGSDTL